MPGIFIAQTNPQRQSVTVNSSLNAVLNAEGAQTAVLFVTSTSSLAGVWEGTFEDIERLVNNAAVGESGADWFDLPSLQTNDSAVTSKLPLATVTVADDDVLFAATMGAKYVRFRRTAGSGTCDLAVSNVSLDDIAKAAGQTQTVTAAESSSTPYHLIADGTDELLISASARRLTAAQIFSLNDAPVYAKFYDKATAPSESDTPIWVVGSPANSTAANGAGNSPSFPTGGIALTNGLGVRVVKGLADNSDTAADASENIVNAAYKLS